MTAMCWLPISRCAGLGLQQLWWMVTPGNPLKSRNHLAPLSERIALSEKIAHDPRIKVTAFEQSLGQSYTARTLEKIRERNRGIRFVWIMGADKSEEFSPLAGLAKDRLHLPHRCHRPPRATRCPICPRRWRKPSITPAWTKPMPQALPGARRPPGRLSTDHAHHSAPRRCGRNLECI